MASRAEVEDLYGAVVVREGDSGDQGQALRKKVTREATAVFRAPDRREAQQRNLIASYYAVCYSKIAILCCVFGV
jgi:hypothetical protein